MNIIVSFISATIVFLLFKTFKHRKKIKSVFFKLKFSKPKDEERIKEIQTLITDCNKIKQSFTLNLKGAGFKTKEILNEFAYEHCFAYNVSIEIVDEHSLIVHFRDNNKNETIKEINF